MLARQARFGALSPETYARTEPLFADETREERRLRQAAGQLADVAWREHPDDRAVRARHRIRHLLPLTLTHGERAFLAYTAFIRDGDQPHAGAAQTPLNLISERQARRAELPGNALRLAITVSAIMTRVVDVGYWLKSGQLAQVALEHLKHFQGTSLWRRPQFAVLPADALLQNWHGSAGEDGP